MSANEKNAIVVAIEAIDAEIKKGNEGIFGATDDRNTFSDKIQDWVKAITAIENEKERLCPDCGAKPNEKHKPGCDVERCPHCGHQALMCLSDESGTLMACCDNMPVTDDELIPWTGRWPGMSECEEYGFWCKMVKGKGWVDCDKNDPEAELNLNRLYDCVWNREDKKFVLKKG